MKIDSGFRDLADLARVPERARALEAAGFDGMVTAELANDPFLPLVLAAEHTERIELMTSIAVAFSRNPMIVANLANDLQGFSKGRFILGLGSQIKPHITKRFSMPWSKPAARMREFVLAMRAIWDCWYEGEKLDFRGEFYTHTLMTPMFTPTNNPHGAPRVVIAGVGPKMTEVAGEVGDGMLVHAFTTAKYLREVTLPAIERGLATSGRSRADFEVCYPPFLVTGNDEREWAAMRTVISRQLAFYGSTPAYRGVLECHGWGELQSELNTLSKRGEWEAMGELITDEILEEFAVVAEPAKVVGELRARFGGLVDRLTCGLEFAKEGERSAYIEELRSA
ncbi:MAG: LLM class F420-dependent oxidoreductase [Deltaproteobacteria bacterium]|jgi:probable F420-dependent oxidoreductase|nr:LLM class F420-dependent oxidoreductase [Deltaproteobacteria bacterium]MBW2499852.1 LLM class F420-dependent oxidoreductase [Deltaproteobacteria bacterium]